MNTHFKLENKISKHINTYAEILLHYCFKFLNFRFSVLLVSIPKFIKSVVFLRKSSRDSIGRNPRSYHHPYLKLKSKNN